MFVDQITLQGCHITHWWLWCVTERINTNNDINNETFKIHNYVRERERERKREKVERVGEREKCTQRNPFRDSLVWWLPGFLTRGMEQWNSVKKPPETKVSHKEKKFAPRSLLPPLLFSTANDAPPEPLHNPHSYTPKLPLLTELFHFSWNTNISI